MSNKDSLFSAVPKPPRRQATTRRPLKRGKPLQRTAMKKRGPRTRKSGGALFPKVKNPAFRRWLVRHYDCVLAGELLRWRISLNDVPGTYLNHNRASYHDGWWHNCWGELEPAHVGQHQAQGAGDVGRCVSLCSAAHRFYDEHRSEFAFVTGWTEARMMERAAHVGRAWEAEQADMRYAGWQRDMSIQASHTGTRND